MPSYSLMAMHRGAGRQYTVAVCHRPMAFLLPECRSGPAGTTTAGREEIMADASLDAVLIQIDSTGQLILGLVLALIMFGVALDLRFSDFAEVARRPLAPLSGLVAQLVLLPAVTWAITMVMQPLPSVALGMMVVAACPGGNLSNLITHMAR